MDYISLERLQIIFYPEDNESGVESIAIKDVCSSNYVEFPETDIKFIEIMD